MNITKGDWKIVKHAVKMGGTTVGFTFGIESEQEKGTHTLIAETISNEDDAFLIAAAPAMLKACKLALAALKSPEARHVLVWTHQIEALNEAIAQAGRE